MPSFDSTLSLGRLLVACGIAYLLGCLNTGYYLVRLRTGQDVRALGSGNAGARNVGRILGKTGFAMTLLGDVLKGSLAVAIAIWIGVPVWGQSIAALAVVAGHIWPIQLRGRGGKGAATALGAVLVLHPWLGIGVLICALMIYALSRAVTSSGIIAMVSTPLLAWWLLPPPAAAGIGLLALLLLFAHRENLRAIMAAYSHRQQS